MHPVLERYLSVRSRGSPDLAHLLPCELRAVAAQGVLAVGDRLKVVGVDAGTIPAEVVKMQPFGNRADEALVVDQQPVSGSTTYSGPVYFRAAWPTTNRTGWPLTWPFARSVTRASDVFSPHPHSQ
jgi:hypothetical protein